MTGRLDDGETILYRLKKSKMPIAILVVLASIWFYFGGLFVSPCWRYLFTGAPRPSSEDFFLAALALGVFIPIIIAILLSYTLNGLIITDRRVILRKGLSGQTLTIRLEDIRSFQHAFSSGRRGGNHKIYFYLHCGRYVRTGELFITMGSLKALLELLRGRFEGRGFTGEELKVLGEQNPSAGQPESRTNPLPLILLLAPMALALLVVLNVVNR